MRIALASAIHSMVKSLNTRYSPFLRYIIWWTRRCRGGDVLTRGGMVGWNKFFGQQNYRGWTGTGEQFCARFNVVGYSLARSIATGRPRCLPRTMMTMTTSFDSGPKAPENEKFSVGIPNVKPIPPKAETSSNTGGRSISHPQRSVLE